MSSSAPGSPAGRKSSAKSKAPGAPRRKKKNRPTLSHMKGSKNLSDELAEAARHSITEDGSNESRAPMLGGRRRRRRKSRKKSRKKSHKKKRKTKRRRKSRKKRTKRRRRR